MNLLCGFVRAQDTALEALDEPLGVRLLQALEAGGRIQRQGLRRVGDLSLFISGYFPDSLRRGLVDVDYYVALGGYAYGSLQRLEHAACAPIFQELSEKFSGFVDVLGEVSERSGLASHTDLLRLYERWLRTGSRRTGEALVAQGIVPIAARPSRRLH